jgi:hypothetical protein
MWIDVADRTTLVTSQNGSNVLGIYNKMASADMMFPSRSPNMTNFTGVGFLSTMGTVSRTGLQTTSGTFNGYMGSLPRGNGSIRNSQVTLVCVAQILTPNNTNSIAPSFWGVLANDDPGFKFGATWNGNNVTPGVTFNALTNTNITANTPFICVFGTDGTNAFLRVNGNATQTNALAVTNAYTYAGFGTAPGSLSGTQFWNNPGFTLFEGLVWSYSLYNVANSNAFTILEGYLADKWNIKSQLPALHPYKVNPPPNGSWLI